MRLNMIGNFKDIPDGYGRHGREVRRGLQERGVDINSIYLREKDWDSLLDPKADLNLELVWWNGLRKLPDIPPTVIFSMFETMKLPDKSVNIINTAGEQIIVPCQWCKDVFEESGVTRPITVIYEGVDPGELPLIDWNKRPNRPFTFLAFGDDRGWRKGFDVAYQAFYQAFGDSRTDVRLVLKSRKEGMKMFEGGMMPSNLSLWCEDVPDVAEVYSHCDCLVFPSCGEGWGLPPREAAAMGVPTIVAAHSGLLEGIDHYATVQLKDLSLTESDMGGSWYRCNPDEVSAAMIDIFNHQERARATAQTCAAWIRTNQTWKQAHDRLYEFLKQVIQ